jgi:hypothetical protein
MNIHSLATFLGWCTVINIGLLLLGGVMWISLKERFSGLVAKWFGVTQEEVKASVLRAFMQYRMAIIFLNLVPYVVLKIMD